MERKTLLDIFGIVVNVAAIVIAATTESLLARIIAISVFLVFVGLLIFARVKPQKKPQVPVNFHLERPLSILPANREDICWIVQKAASVYKPLDVMPLNLMLEWFENNPTGFYIFKDGTGHRYGNLDILPIKPRFLQLLLKGTLIEREIAGDFLYKPVESHLIDSLYIESLVSDRMFATYQCLMNVPSIVEGICEPAQVKAIYALEASQAGLNLIEDLGFEMIEDGSKRRDKHKVFCATLRGLIEGVCKHALNDDRVKCRDFLKRIS